jgi:membrane-associated protease RseP (regulator of RpoE activity)
MTQLDPHPRRDEVDERPAEGEIRSHPARLAALAAGVVALGVLGGLPILIVVLALVLMIFLHELGHFLTAKAAGMKVTEYFIGFGPRIWSFRRGETEYGVKAIPAGAYVRIIGMNNLDQVDPADEAHTYRQKSYGRRMSVAVAGSAMHFLMAIVLAFTALVAYGEVTDDSQRDWTVSELSDTDDLRAEFAGIHLDERLEGLLSRGETPASAAGLEPGDRVVAVDGEELEEFGDLRAWVQDHPGETATLTVTRDGDTFDTTVTLGALSSHGESIGFLGVAHEVPRERLGPVEAAGRSLQQFGEISVASVQGIGRFFSPSGLSNFVSTAFDAGNDEPPEDVVTGSGDGPSADDDRIISIYGAARIGAQATDAEGALALLRFMVLLNIFIGIFNLVPLLPLDGGHVAIATYERIREFGTGRRYHADITKLLPLTYAVVLLLVTVGALALYVDIADPINLSQ